MTYADVFRITPTYIVEFVRQSGWDRRVVDEVAQRPPDAQATAEHYIYPGDVGWVWARPVHRGEWIEVVLGTLELARLEVAKALLYQQWSGWNHENKKRRGLEGRLMDLYPPMRE